MAVITHLDTRSTDRRSSIERSAGTGTLDFRPDVRAWLAEREATVGRRSTATPDVPTPRASVVAPAPVPAAVPTGAARRLLLAVGALVAATALWSVGGWLNGPGVGVEPVGADLTDAAQPVVIVQPGDTLWTIAADLEPEGDIRALVDRLAERNGGTMLTVGQVLVVGE